jgi:hypothetical protein
MHPRARTLRRLWEGGRTCPDGCFSPRSPVPTRGVLAPGRAPLRRCNHDRALEVIET